MQLFSGTSSLLVLVFLIKYVDKKKYIISTDVFLEMAKFDIVKPVDCPVTITKFVGQYISLGNNCNTIYHCRFHGTDVMTIF